MIPIYLIAIAVSFIGYFFFTKIAKTFGLIDQPSTNNIHKEQTLTQYGFIYIVIFCLFIIYLDFNEYFGTLTKLIPRPGSLIISILCLSLLSLVDFKLKIHPFFRLILQFSFVFLSISSLQTPIFGNYIPYKVEILILSYFWVYIINSTNFIDGIDSSLNLISLSVIVGSIIVLKISDFSFSDDINIVLIILICCLLPFFIFNLPSAKVFCGDSGSIPMGYMLGWFNLFIYNETNKIFVLILSSYILIDVTITLLKKCIKKRVPWSRDFDYFFLIPTKYQNKKHSYTLTILFINQMILSLLAILSIYYDQTILLIVSIVQNLLTIMFFNSLKSTSN